MYKKFGKRAFDLVCASVAFIVNLPLLAVLFVLVKVTSKGPVIFKQTRVGKDFKAFTIYKFRTMTTSDKNDLLITSKGDQRITPFGGFLRKYKGDELPQLLNVIKGDLSLVGPRPEVKKYVDMFEEDYKTILSVRPGITDPATLYFNDEECLLASLNPKDVETIYTSEILPEKIALSKGYVTSLSLKNDVDLLVKTLKKIFSKKDVVIKKKEERSMHV